jgi:hypothetical protein
MQGIRVFQANKDTVISTDGNDSELVSTIGQAGSLNGRSSLNVIATGTAISLYANDTTSFLL